MVDLMGLLSDALIGSFQMLMLNDLGKNMFPYASIELLNKKIVPGIYYATDIIKGDIVLGDLPKLNIDLNISEYVMQEESFDDEFEEGTI